MHALQTLEQNGSQQRAGTRPAKKGWYESSITGGSHRITTAQLYAMWFCYQTRQIDGRSLRAFFALCEMQERRTAGKSSNARFTLDELLRLTGCSGATERARRQWRVAIKQLRVMGIADMSEERIRLFETPDQLVLENPDRLQQALMSVPNLRRPIPVPRRLIRALAGGFSRSLTGVIFAQLISSLFWHKERGVRVDGRAKAGWIVEMFGLSERAVRSARSQLIDLGWLVDLKAPAWARNKWGLHTRLDVSWQPSQNETHQKRTESILKRRNDIVDGQSSDARVAPPTRRSDTVSAGPDHTRTPSYLRHKNQNPQGKSPGTRSGVSIRLKSKKRHPAKPTITDVAAQDLSCLLSMQSLYEQALQRGLADPGYSGRLEFFGFSIRARARSENPAKLFSWFLRHRDTARGWLSESDDSEAHAWLKSTERRESRADRTSDRSGPQRGLVPPPDPVLQEPDVKALIAARRDSFARPQFDTWDILRDCKGWTRERYDAANALWEVAEKRRISALCAKRGPVALHENVGGPKWSGANG